MKFEYHVVSGQVPSEAFAGASFERLKEKFEEDVADFLNNGYKLAGGLVIANNGCFCQAVYREVED
jgi:hypothetical protein